MHLSAIPNLINRSPTSRARIADIMRETTAKKEPSKMVCNPIFPLTTFASQFAFSTLTLYVKMHHLPQRPLLPLLLRLFSRRKLKTDSAVGL